MRKLLTNIGKFFRTLWFHRRIIRNLEKERFGSNFREIYMNQNEIGWKIEDNALFSLLCQSAVEMINLYPEALNCFEIKFLGEKDSKEYQVIIQRLEGKTPMDLYVECNAKYQEARELLAKITQQAQIHFDENKTYRDQLNIQQGRITLDSNEVAAENARLRRRFLNISARLADLMDKEEDDSLRRLQLLKLRLYIIDALSDPEGERLSDSDEKTIGYDTIVAQWSEGSVLEYFLYDSQLHRKEILQKSREYHSQQDEGTLWAKVNIEDLLNEYEPVKELFDEH